MVKCGIWEGEAPKQPCITEEGKCDICGKKVTLANEEKMQDKINIGSTQYLALNTIFETFSGSVAKIILLPF